MAKFKRGDKVAHKDTETHPFWFTVISVTSTRVYCNYGVAGNYMGSFAMDEVELYQEPSKK